MKFSHKNTSNKRQDSQSKRPVRAQSFFRRNQTIVGELTYQDDARDRELSSRVDHSNRARVHNLAKKRKQVLKYIGISTLLIATLYLLLVNFSATIVITTERGNDIERPVDTGKYALHIQNYLRNNPIQRLAFFRDNKALSEYMQEEFPEIYTLQSSGSSGFGVWRYSLAFREPVAVWQFMDDQDSYVDTRGAIFTDNYYAEPNIRVIDDSGITDGSGSAIIGQRILGTIGRIVTNLRGYGYEVTEVILPQDTLRSLEVKINNKNYSVIFSVDPDRLVGQQGYDAHMAMTHLMSSPNKPREYIDVRVAGRVVYR
jgi:hypothetical protein